MEIEEEAVLNIVKLEILQSAPSDPKSNSRNRASKFPKYVPCGTLSPKYDHVFFEMFYILGFLIDSHIKISKRHKFCKIWLIVNKRNSLYSPIVSSGLIKFA